LFCFIRSLNFGNTTSTLLVKKPTLGIMPKEHKKTTPGQFSSPKIPVVASSDHMVSSVCTMLMNESSSELSRSWHAPTEHIQLRNSIKYHISHLILKRKTGSTSEWLAKLPEVSSRIEKILYAAAESLEKYVSQMS
jgi:hypothetical protein